jgi:hypothetical protein
MKTTCGSDSGYPPYRTFALHGSSGAAWPETGAAKAPVKVLTIDHVERPSEN